MVTVYLHSLYKWNKYRLDSAVLHPFLFWYQDTIPRCFTYRWQQVVLYVLNIQMGINVSYRTETHLVPRESTCRVASRLLEQAVAGCQN